MNDLEGCPIGRDWDEYVLAADADKNLKLTKHLGTCGYCRLLVVQRKQELAALATAWEQSARARVIELHLQRSDLESPSVQTSLAAKGNGKPVMPEGVTLASPEQEMLLKIVRDPHSFDVWLYILAERSSYYDHVIVKPFGHDSEYVTDSAGRVNLGQIEWPESDLMKAEVRLPEAVFVLSPLREELVGQSAVNLTTSRGDEIIVTLSGDARNRRLDIQLIKLSGLAAEVPLKVAIREPGEGGALHVRTLTASRAEFDSVKSTQDLEIYLYQ
jgi:hypothetical protein